MRRGRPALARLAVALCLALAATTATAAADCPEPSDAAKPGPCLEAPPPATGGVPDLNALRAPDSPAFHALGLGSEDIQRPTTPIPATVALANGVASGKVLLPLQNLGVELAPYWTQRRPDVTREFMEAHKELAWWRNLTLSLAVTHRDEDVRDDTGAVAPVSTALAALGARTTLYPGEPSEVAIACQRYLVGEARRDAIGVAKAITAGIATWERDHPQPPLNPDYRGVEPNMHDPRYLVNGVFDLAAFNRDAKTWREQTVRSYAEANPARIAWEKARLEHKQQLLQAYEAEHPVTESDEEARCRQLVHERQGFVVDIAAAHVLRAPLGDLERTDDVVAGGQTTSEWLTVGWLFEHVSLLTALRLRQQTGGVLSDSLDAGARVIGAWNRIGVSLEGTYRRQLDDGADRDLYRVAIGADYRLSGGMWVRAAFGKDFGVSNDETPIIALANLQWSFDLERGVHPDRMGAGR